MFEETCLFSDTIVFDTNNEDQLQGIGTVVNHIVYVYKHSLNIEYCQYCSDWMIPISILPKSISDRHRPVRVADGPMTARCRFT